MKTKELTKIIYKKYPGVWDDIKRTISKQAIGTDIEVYYNMWMLEKDKILFEPLREYNEIMPLKYLYADLEQYFQENDLYINIEYDYEKIAVRISNETEWLYQNHYKEIREAKEQALIKACEILEGML